MPARAIALLGAECTGKSTLAREVQAALVARGQSCTRIDEHLRQWCAQHGRTPRSDEQPAIAAGHYHAIAQGMAQDADWTLCDTTPLITAVYSDLLFHDTSLYPAALEHQRGYALNLLTGCDLPWVADGIQRDGELQRLRFDQRLRDVLVAHRIPYAVILGHGPMRLRAAMRSIEPLEGAAQPAAATAIPWKWMCERCSDAQCEHRLFRGIVNADGGDAA